jgi:formylglycine-generating enzyme required for sulfatase activity
MRGILFAIAFVLGIAPGCAPADEATGQVLVIVDTDAPVPKLVARLRIDVYAEDGSWYASRDVALGSPSAWPTSFGVHAPDASRRVAIVRLRAYPEGKERDYRGERFVARPPPDAAPLAVTPPPLATDEPRLLGEAGDDQTPPTEPEPLLAIDRLVRVRIDPGGSSATRIILRGACAGTMADLEGRASCVDTEDVRVPLADETIDPDRTLPRSLVGTFDPPRPCAATPRGEHLATDGTPLHDDEVCVPGGAFVFGSPDNVFTVVDDLPERVAIVSPFLIDRFEVTVARYRDAVARGFVSPDPTPGPNEGPLPTDPVTFTIDTLCSWSASPQDRETYALSCVSAEMARAFCRFEGGDLPSEVQWEYAAAIAGRAARTRFAWGGATTTQPGCDRAVWGRGEIALFTQQCIAGGFGPLAVEARLGDAGDVTPGLGIVGMGGGVSEITRDAFAPLSANCWARAPLLDPGCEAGPKDELTGRGGSWRDNAVSLLVAMRRGAGGTSSVLGFRCARKGTP